ncbi:response regulator transcription factor [Chloroflexota bacterium]
MRILLIESDALTLEVIRSYLEFYIPDLTLLTTTLGVEGIRICKHGSPDLIILDIDLPDSDGAQVLGTIRDTSDIPIIVICSTTDDEIMGHLLKTGADEVIAQPFNAADLLSCIAGSLKKRGIKPVFRFDPPYQSGVIQQ